MILALFVHGMVHVNCELRLSDKWHAFVKNHIIDWDRSDPQTREYLEELEREERERKEREENGDDK